MTDRDPELVALVDAARIIVDNGRMGPDCCYQWIPGDMTHTLGTKRTCALCQLANAVRAFDSEPG